MKNFIKVLLIGFVSLSGLISCGDPKIDITSVAYEPKIVVEGYLFADEPVRGIRVMRNFALNQPIDTLSFILDPTITTVKINGDSLLFDIKTYSYYSNNIIVSKGSPYTLEVWGTIDGKELYTTAVTTVPADGFELIKKHPGKFKYGTPIPMDFIPLSPAGFYAFSIRPDSASLSNFIFDNEFNQDMKPEEIQKNLGEFRLRANVVFNIKPNLQDTIKQPIESYNTWFRSTYKTIIYAGDVNFKEYLLSAPNVKEFDGNFHEPKIILKGDGIGVFASAIRDTAYFEVY